MHVYLLTLLDLQSEVKEMKMYWWTYAYMDHIETCIEAPRFVKKEDAHPAASRC